MSYRGARFARIDDVLCVLQFNIGVLSGTFEVVSYQERPINAIGSRCARINVIKVAFHQFNAFRVECLDRSRLLL